MTTIDRIKRLHPGISDQHAKDAAMVVDAIREAFGKRYQLVENLWPDSDAVCAYWSHIDLYIYTDLAALYYHKADGRRSSVYGKPTPEWARVFAAIARLVKEEAR